MGSAKIPGTRSTTPAGTDLKASEIAHLSPGWDGTGPGSPTPTFGLDLEDGSSDPGFAV